MKKIILTLVFMSPTWSLAQEYCTLKSEDPEKIVHVDNAPQFFAKVRSQGDYVFYISSHDSNHLLSTTDTDDNTRDVQIVGDIDPVPSPDGRILTIPGVAIYLAEDVITKKANARPIHTDNSNDGVYQSVALVNVEADNAEVRTYRVVVDADRHIQYRDYKIEFDKTPVKVTPLRRTTTHCPNQSVSTIMVSKTGRYVTGFDTKSNTSKIFDMSDLEGSDKCRELYDLGYGVGKIEFNVAKPRAGQAFDFEKSDTQIAFHMDYFSSNVSSYFSTVESGMSKDVYTMDLEVPERRTGNWKLKPGNIRKLFNEVRLGSGGYYPSYTMDGKVAMIFDDSEAFSFRFYDPNRTKPYDFFLVPPADTFERAWRDEASLPPNWKERFHRVATIGVLWSQVCLPEESQRADITAVGASSYFLGLTKESCTEMVNTQWASMKAQIVANPIWGQDPRFSTQMIQGYGPNDLLQACGAIKERLPPREPVVIGTPSASHLTRDQLMHHYCMGCHVPGGRMLGILGDAYPNQVDFTRTVDDFPKTNLAHLLSSRRRVDTGIKHDENPQGRRPPDSMPPVNAFESPDRTDFDHGANVKEIIEDDIRSVMAMPKRVPLYLRGRGRQEQQAPAQAEAGATGTVEIFADGAAVESFSMPPVSRRRESTDAQFALVNGTNQELTEINADRLTGAFLFTGRNLFPGEGGDCGASLAPGQRCTFSVSFAPSRRDVYATDVAINYVIRRSNRRREAQVSLSVDGVYGEQQEARAEPAPRGRPQTPAAPRGRPQAPAHRPRRTR